LAFRLARPCHAMYGVGLGRWRLLSAWPTGRHNPQPISSESFVSGAIERTITKKRDKPTKNTLFPRPHSSLTRLPLPLQLCGAGKSADSANTTLKRRGLRLQLSTETSQSLEGQGKGSIEGGETHRIALPWAQQRRLVLVLIQLQLLSNAW
jgi:hypothetical protein